MDDSENFNLGSLIFLQGCILAAGLLRFPMLQLLVTRDESASAVSSLTRVLTVYRGPTNHIFHEILTQGALYLGGFNHVSLRVVPFAAGLLLVPVTYYFGQLFFNEYAGILSSVLVVTSYPLIDISTEAVGYSLLVLICVACYDITLRTIRDPSKGKFLLLGVMFSLGAYTIPLMIYPAGICCAWLLIHAFVDTERRWLSVVKQFLVTLITAGIFTTLFFLPVILNRGFQFITGNRHLNPEPYGVMIWENLQLIATAVHDWSGGFPLLYGVIGAVGLLVSAFLGEHNLEVRSLLIGTIGWFSLAWLVHPVDLFKTRFLIYLLPLGFVLVSGGLVICLDLLLGNKQKLTVLFVGGIASLAFYTQFKPYRNGLDAATMKPGFRYVKQLRVLIRDQKEVTPVRNPYSAIRLKYFLSEPFIPSRYRDESYYNHPRQIVATIPNRPFRQVRMFYRQRHQVITRKKLVYSNRIGKIYSIEVSNENEDSLLF